MTVIFRHRGNFSKTEKFLKGFPKIKFKRILENYAQEGVRALALATPVDTRLTADSWGYEINISKGSFSISWVNTNVNQGVSIAIILQYGHATGTGGFVKGQDYINPAIQPIFDKIADNVWREVTKL